MKYHINCDQGKMEQWKNARMTVCPAKPFGLGRAGNPENFGVEKLILSKTRIETKFPKGITLKQHSNIPTFQ